MKLKWTIALEVDEFWVAEGFDPDDAQITDAILGGMLRYAYPSEVKAKVIKRPKDADIAKVQGYKSITKYRTDNWRGKSRR